MLKVNEYFEGRVKSIGFQTTTLPATVGVIAAGEYAFGTHNKETMTVVSGRLLVQFAGGSEWHSFDSGQSFDVEARSSFKVRAIVDTAYLCLYWQE